jgi:L-fucose mutarotase
MLKNIDRALSPEALRILCEMGHGDEIVIADGNFPAASMARRLIRADGHGTVAMLRAVASLIPLDTYSDPNVMLMEVVPGDKVETPIWDEYLRALKETEKAANIKIGHLERFAFYERAKSAYAVIATGDSALYANIIIKKGVL